MCRVTHTRFFKSLLTQGCILGRLQVQVIDRDLRGIRSPRCWSSVLMIPRISIAAFSMSPFDSLFPFTASNVETPALHISDTISERNDCKFCVALQRDLTITKHSQQTSFS